MGENSLNVELNFVSVLREKNSRSAEGEIKFSIIDEGEIKFSIRSEGQTKTAPVLRKIILFVEGETQCHC